MEDAVRWVILTIIFVFDPLAVLLLIAANMSLHKPKSIKTAVNVNNVDDEWNEIKVETDESQPEFFIQNEDPENTVEWSEELEPDKEKRKRKKSVANTSSNYGSITDISKEKNEKALRENGTFGNVNKKD